MEDTDESPTQSKLSLEEKMKMWEASEEEIKAASLGEIVPGRSDAFDVGLYILFPIMVLGLGLFAFFPIIVQNIDVNSVGPPPTSWCNQISNNLSCRADKLSPYITF